MAGFDEVVDPRGGRWLIDRRAVSGLVNTAAYAAAFAESARLVRYGDGFLQKVGVAPDHAKIDWDDAEVRRLKAEKVEAHRQACRHLFGSGGALMREYLVHLRASTMSLNYGRNALFADAQAINAANIRWAERGITGARFVRDGAVAAMGIVATVATGGAAPYFIIAAAGAKGAASYQDTGDVAKALRSGAFQVVALGSGKLIARLPRSEATLKVGLSFIVDTGVGYGEGVLVDEAAHDAALEKAVTSALIKAGVEAGAASALGAEAKGRVGRQLYKVRGVLGDTWGAATSDGVDVTRALTFEATTGLLAAGAEGLATAAAGEARSRGGPVAAGGGDPSSARAFVGATVMRAAP